MKSVEQIVNKKVLFNKLIRALEHIDAYCERDCDRRFLTLRLLREYSGLSRKECADISGYGSSASARGAMTRRPEDTFELRLIYDVAVKIMKS